VTTPATTNQSAPQGLPNPKAQPAPVTGAQEAAAADVGGPRGRVDGTRGARTGLLREVVRRASWRFYVCIGCLVVSAATMALLAAWLSIHFQKAAVPLKRPLSLLDVSKLLPEYELHTFQPEALSHDAVETLGTDQYMNWAIVDRRRDRDDPTCVAHLFVSYYTGKPDMVPHVPEECVVAGGQKLVGRARTEVIAVPGVGAEGDRVAVRVCQFEQGAGGQSSLFGPARELPSFCVLYLFHVNGECRSTRDEVRLAQMSLFDRYAYYAKIEVKFTDYGIRRYASQAESLAATESLLGKVMPILLEDHLADWEALSSGAGDSESGPSDRDG